MIIPTEIIIKLIQLLSSSFNKLELFPIVGTELEFYLFPLDNNQSSLSWQADKLNISTEIEQEKGESQYEIRTNPQNNIIAAAQEIIYWQEKIKNQAKKQAMRADFSAKPKSNQPGSALHIHFNLTDVLGNNLYSKNGNIESLLMLYSLGGLCKNMNENIIFCAPYPQAYQRYTTKDIQSPSKVCWGANNRSAAIRIPLSENKDRRLEYRIACADACPFSVMALILYGIFDGIENQILPPEKLHGNAFLDQYQYPLLPNFDEANKLFEQSNLSKLIREIMAMDHNPYHRKDYSE